MVDMEKNEGSKGENDRKADSCGETARTRITTKREREEGRGKREKGRKREMSKGKRRSQTRDEEGTNGEKRKEEDKEGAGETRWRYRREERR